MPVGIVLQQKDAHDPGPGHPDRPDRIDACTSVLAEFGDVVLAKPGPATRDQLTRAHTERYLDGLERFCIEGGGWIDRDTFAGPESFESSVSASGAVCDAVSTTLSRGNPSFCLVRPPGHHAGPDFAMGFCLINHAAVGAHQAIASGAERVFMVDFDVHHGHGTQDIFWEDPRVLYLSMHQAPWYPGTGALDETGGGAGAGATVNLPLRAGGGDEMYAAIMERIVVPVGRRFRPDVIIASAGFDAHSWDPLSLMEVSSGGFGAITSAILELAAEVCGGRLVMTLEGGYDLDALSESFAASIRALSGERAGTAPRDAAYESEELDRIVAFHRRQWEIA
jgi:acetoin utilization deacetylase AcuC-like enzyme